MFDPTATSSRPEIIEVSDRWGLPLRPLWAIEDGLRFLNHGAFGATPREIMAEQAAWRDRMEANTARFFMQELPALLRQAAIPLARFVGTQPDRLAFVTNATSGINAVVRSLRFAPGDEILGTDHTYGAVRHALRHVADQAGATLVEAEIGLPVTGPAQVTDAVAARIGPRTRLVVIDHITSASALEFPVAGIAALCRAHGVPVLVDGAHAPGQLELDVDRIDADWYVGNCHKWLCAPKGAAFIVRTARPTQEVHPLAISHAYGQGFIAEFDKVGTHDASAVLSVPAALDFHDRIGGAALRARNRALAASVAQDVATGLGVVPFGPPGMHHAMVAVPLPGKLPATREEGAAIQAMLWSQHRIEAAISAVCGALHLRLSVHAYNHAGEYAGLADVLHDALERRMEARAA